MIKAVIFDCFGVLAVDGWLPLKRKYIGSNEQLNQAVSDLGRQNERGYIDNETYYQQTAALMGIDENLLKTTLHGQSTNDELFEFIASFLKPRVRVGLLTNANYNVLKKLFSNQQASLFDVRVMSYEDKLVKPDPRMFDLILARLGLSAGECVIVDDVERYCTAAADYGFVTIWHQDNQSTIAEIKRLLAAR